MKKFITVIITLIFIVPVTYANNKLIFVSIITRHGDRAPFMNIENSKYDWGTSLSELTPIGMNQEYNLGKQLRTRYIDQFKLLPKNYKDQSIYVLSSDTNRTIVSAQSLLMGLYPPGTGPSLENGKAALPNNFQPIPIRTLPKNSRLITFPYPEYIKVLENNIYNTKTWQQKTKQLQPYFKNWSKILGNKITGLDAIIAIGDVLTVAKSHHKPLPKGLSQQDADLITKMTNWGLTYEFKSQKVAYILGGQLTNKMIQDLKNAASGKSKYKITYYSGHDLTLLEVMGTLGVPLQKAPSYASNLQLELYKNNHTYLVKLRYNGKYIKLPIMNKDNSCTLDQLAKYMDSINKKFAK